MSERLVWNGVWNLFADFRYFQFDDLYILSVVFKKRIIQSGVGYDTASRRKLRIYSILAVRLEDIFLQT